MSYHINAQKAKYRTRNLQCVLTILHFGVERENAFSVRQVEFNQPFNILIAGALISQ